MEDSCEIWKDVEGYEGIYQISNFGRLKSFSHHKEYIRKPSYDKRGYARITLYKNKNQYITSIHRLVAKTFIPIPQELLDQGYTYETLEVNHIDENPSNNHVENLEWCTKLYNVQYSQGYAISQFDMEGNWVANWPSVSEAERMYGAYHTAILACCNLQANYANNSIWRFWKPEYKEGYKLDISDLNLTGKFNQKVTQFDMEGNFIKIWPSIVEAAKSILTASGRPTHGIASCCKGKSNFLHGYIWRYTTAEHKPGYKLDISNLNLCGKNVTSVCQFDSDGNFIKKWPSLISIKEFIPKICTTNILQGCRYPYRKPYGYYWRHTLPEYKEGYNLFSIDYDKLSTLPVAQIDMSSNKVIAIYPNILTAYKCKTFPFSTTNGWQNIYFCCLNLKPNYQGYNWKFIYNNSIKIGDIYATNELK